MEPKFFKTPKEWRAWLDKNHDKETEVFVGFYKVGTGKPSMVWSEAVDQAICYGWIDGIRRSIDGESYSNRFTPRKPNSNWSAINIKKVENLTKAGLMKPAGITAFEKRTDARSNVYSFENEPKTLDANYEKLFRANKKAWAFFTSQPPGYQRLNIFRVMSAKQEKTQLSRLEKLIAASESGKRID